jgi:hypothetical protein
VVGGLRRLIGDGVTLRDRSESPLVRSDAGVGAIWRCYAAWMASLRAIGLRLTSAAAHAACNRAFLVPM